MLVHNECLELNDAFRYDSRRSHNKKPEQAHHISQDAAFRDKIPTNEGLSVNLHGNIRTDVASPHYNVHETLENFWSDYRYGGKYYGKKPTVGQYNRAAYDSLVNAGIGEKQAAHYIRQAYEQQRSYGLTNKSFVPRIPGPIHLPKQH